MPGTLLPQLECSLCSASITGGVQCGSCKKYLDYDCAIMSETDWNKMEENERAAWKCPTCLIPSSGYHQVSLQAVLEEIRELKRQLSVLPILIEAVCLVKEELANLRYCGNQNPSVMDDLSQQLTVLEDQVKDLETLKDVVYTLQCYVEKIRFLTVETGQVPARYYDNALRKVMTFIRS